MISRGLLNVSHFRSLRNAQNVSSFLPCASLKLNSRFLSEESASFGYKKVKKEEKQGKVNEVFSAVAKKYDIMNDAMSFGVHRLWKDKFIQDLNPKLNMRLLDVAGGTGN